MNFPTEGHIVRHAVGNSLAWHRSWRLATAILFCAVRSACCSVEEPPVIAHSSIFATAVLGLGVMKYAFAAAASAMGGSVRVTVKSGSRVREEYPKPRN